MASGGALEYAEARYSEVAERERLILEHLPQVRWVATRIHEHLPDRVSLDDLISTGILGLIAAIDGYDPTYNVKIATYAEHKIRGAILDSIRGLDGVPSHKRKKVKQIESAIAAVEQRLKRSATEEEIAAELGMDVAEYHQTLVDVRAVTIGTLDGPVGEDGASLLTFLSDDEERLPTRQFERSELEKVVAEGIDKLPAVERLVLNLYYKEEQHLREIAEILKVHVTRVSQLKSQGILRLRAYMEKYWPVRKGIL